jgi:hypothetical protein
MAQQIFLIKSTKTCLFFFFGSSLKKKLKDKMAEFQVVGQTYGSLDYVFLFHLFLCHLKFTIKNVCRLYGKQSIKNIERSLRGVSLQV